MTFNTNSVSIKFSDEEKQKILDVISIANMLSSKMEDLGCDIAIPSQDEAFDINDINTLSYTLGRFYYINRIVSEEN